MPRAVNSVPGSLLRVAENRVIEFLGIKPGAFDGALPGDGAQFLCGEVFQLAAVTPERSTGSADDGDIAGFQHVDFLVLFEIRLVLRCSNQTG